MFAYILIASLFACSLATEVTKCDDKPFPLWVEIPGCDVQPCPIIKGTTGYFRMEFITDHEVKNLTTFVTAKVFGVNVNYPVPDEAKFGCDHLLYGSYCPLHKGEDVGMIFELFIGTFYPEIALNVEISVKDEDERVVTCFKTDIQVMRQQLV